MDAQNVKKLVKDLVDLMKANDLSEMKIIDGQTEIMLKRAVDGGTPQVVAMPSIVAAAPAAAGTQVTPGPAAQAPGAGPTQTDDGLEEIVSPMVGTFYSSPSPTADPFVDVGSPIDQETTVCVIEAMKVMNEIKSDIVGTIKEVFVSNGAAVEYGQRLFLVERG